MRHVTTLFQRPDRVEKPLYVVTPLFNSSRYRSRWRLFEDFIRMVEDHPKTVFVGVEVAFGNRAWSMPQMVGEQGEPLIPPERQVLLRTSNELWLKENAINLGVQWLSQIDPDWKYVAWVDGDVTFARQDWPDETIQRLQHHPFVQMWSEMEDLDQDHNVVGKNRSFAQVWVDGSPRPKDPGDYPYYGRQGYPGAPGLAWACTREGWDAVGGLVDWCIMGACDWYMAHALVGELERVIKPVYSAGYTEPLFVWQGRAERLVRRNLGVVPGLALHYWHGPKIFRRYATRERILIDSQFDPRTDLKRDWQGLYAWSDDVAIKLKHGVRRYFHERYEDDPNVRPAPH